MPDFLKRLGFSVGRSDEPEILRCTLDPQASPPWFLACAPAIVRLTACNIPRHKGSESWRTIAPAIPSRPARNAANEKSALAIRRIRFVLTK